MKKLIVFVLFIVFASKASAVSSSILETRIQPVFPEPMVFQDGNCLLVIEVKLDYKFLNVSEDARALYPLGYVDGMSLYNGYFAEGFGLDPYGLEILPGIDDKNLDQNLVNQYYAFQEGLLNLNNLIKIQDELICDVEVAIAEDTAYTGSSKALLQWSSGLLLVTGVASAVNTTLLNVTANGARVAQANATSTYLMQTTSALIAKEGVNETMRQILLNRVVLMTALHTQAKNELKKAVVRTPIRISGSMVTFAKTLIEYEDLSPEYQALYDAEVKVRVYRMTRQKYNEQVAQIRQQIQARYDAVQKAMKTIDSMFKRYFGTSR